MAGAKNESKFHHSFRGADTKSAVVSLGIGRMTPRLPLIMSGTASAKVNLDRPMSSTPVSRFLFRFSIAGLVLFLLIACGNARAQDAVRPSLAGEAAAEARRQSIEHIPYNLLVGRCVFVSARPAAFEYNDNIDLADVHPEEDFIRPQINLNALWPITQINTLRLDIGMGYSFYLDHPEDNTNGMLIAPGSQLAFDIFVGDFRINFHDRILAPAGSDRRGTATKQRGGLRPL